MLAHRGAAPDSAGVRRPRRREYPAPNGGKYLYERPRPFSFLPNMARDLAATPRATFRRAHVPLIAGVVSISFILWGADQEITDGAKQLGRALNLNARSTQTTLVAVPIRYGNGRRIDLEFNVPDNLNSTFYYLGDGWTHLSITGGFWAYGLIGRDNRAAQTASQLLESILVTGLATQTIKHLTGRESPYTTTYPRGRWRLFPNQVTYSQHVPNYDAYPTGHLATAMATLTVIADNYPEYRGIRPVGYGLMGLLGYAMLNNGVHWASDYPLGIAMGWGFAKLAVARGRREVPALGSLGAHRAARRGELTVGPGQGGLGLRYRW
ncbi:MAG: phosphatase PAP2 family protein [Hymenobacteraceae bacterium]|nr:phosphatase PAP2 family protein [Hymenobacteraceae bacterium]